MSDKCLSCQNLFDTEAGVPILLPCNHSACQTCLFTEFRRIREIKCPYCQSVCKQNPNDLPKNQELIKQLQRKCKETQEKTIQCIELNEQNLKQILKQLYQSQVLMTKQALQMINQTIFQQNNQIHQQITDLLTILKVKKYQLSKEQNQNLENVIQESQYILQNIGMQRWQKGIQEIEEQKEKMLIALMELFNRFSKDKADLIIRNIRNIDQNNESQTKERQNKLEFVQDLNNDQAYKPKFVHFFDDDTQKLHLFDINTQEYKMIEMEQKIMGTQRSIEYLNYFYLVGGDEMKTIFKIDQQGKSVQLQDMLQARGNFGIAGAQNKIFVVGGKSGQEFLKTVESYEIQKDE